MTISSQVIFPIAYSLIHSQKMFGNPKNQNNILAESQQQQ